MARPTKYKEEYNQQAYELCLLGFIDKELAEHFGVSERSINEWKNKFPQFSQSIKKGKAPADAKVTAALFKRATGYEFIEQKVVYVGGKNKLVDTTKHFPPDATSAIFWLKNRQPKKWRDKKDFEHTGNVTFTDEWDENKEKQTD